MSEQVYFISLGCAKNRVDSEVMLGRLQAHGYRITGTPEKAAVIIVNTCSFIRSAVEESIETILEAARFKEQGLCRVLGVTGCFPQRYREELVGRLPEVDFFLGTESFWGIAQQVREALTRAGGGTTLDLKPDAALWREPWERLLTTPPGTAYLKIAEGCSNRCAYCTIPDIRGPFRSRDPKILVMEAESLAARGVKELVLVAQDTTAYGGDLSRPASLSELIKALAGIDPIQWIRLLYLRPERVTPRLLETMTSVKKFCPYLDIPIQHASDRILKAMNRPYRQRDLKALFRRIRRTWPRVALRTTVMVGFPGEEEEDFQELLHFVEEAAFDHLGVFRYSPEEGTPAALLPGKIAKKTINNRYNLLLARQKKISWDHNREFVGRVEPVLITGPSSESEWLLEGRTRFQAPEVDGVVYITDGTPRIGEINPAKIIEAHPYDLVGEAL
jgi:ribosomal protein S12 methylthiotransferase